MLNREVEKKIRDHDAQLEHIGEELESISNNFNKRRIPLTFNNDTGHFSTFSGDKACNGILTMNNDGSSGYLIYKNRVGYETVTYNMPIGVLIGDSIMEGHPATHGRLHSSTGTVDLSKANEKGQLAYYFEQAFKIPIINQGIGGQSYDQIRARWNRDVLGETTSLTPSKTLDKKPHFVVLGTGINDIFKDRTIEQMKDDIIFFINSCNENNISLIICNCGTHASNTSEKISKIKEYNSWLNEESKKYSHVKIFDFYNWTNDINNDGYPRSGVFVDGVHPTMNTYMEMSNEIIGLLDSSFNAIIPNYLIISNINNMLKPVNNTVAPSCVLLSINGEPHSFHKLNNGDFSSIKLPNDKVINTLGISIKLPISATTSYSYVGFGEVFLSDSDIYKTDMKSNSIIKKIKSVNGIAQFRSCMMQDSGVATFVPTANANNCIGIYVLPSSNDIGYVSTKGLAVCQTTNTPNEYGYIITSTSGQFTCTNNPSGGIVGKVIDYNSDLNLALVDIL